VLCHCFRRQSQYYHAKNWLLFCMRFTSARICKGHTYTDRVLQKSSAKAHLRCWSFTFKIYNIHSYEKRCVASSFTSELHCCSLLSSLLKNVTAGWVSHKQKDTKSTPHSQNNHYSKHGLIQTLLRLLREQHIVVRVEDWQLPSFPLQCFTYCTEIILMKCIWKDFIGLV